MTFESDVAAISSRSLWFRARDRAESTGTAVRWMLDYDGAVMTVAKWDVTSGPKVSTASPPPLSTQSIYFDVAMPLTMGRVVMAGMVDVVRVVITVGCGPGDGVQRVDPHGQVLGQPWRALRRMSVPQFATGFAATGYTLTGAPTSVRRPRRTGRSRARTTGRRGRR